ncbi:MAG: TRAP transporter large permease [Synergistaceae bacterium]|jgi:C4-dicarboxylate transporter DctM subunit|nr:TRAP transporter large permease [Synergistaceae bacterium]
MAVTIFSIFLLLLVIKIPVSFCLAISSVMALVLVGTTDPLIVVQRLCRSVESFSLIAIPFFVLSGGFMDSGGISKRLVNFASSLVGHIKGGLAMISILAAMFFAGISGSGAADTAAIGSILIPAMESKGYGKDFATSVMATAGSIGIIIPPSIPMVVLGVTAGISIGGLFLGGVIPGILVGLALMTTSWLFASARKLPSEKRATWSERWACFKESILALMTMVIIMGGILGGIFTPTEASVIAAIYAFFVGMFVYKELRWKDLPGIMVRAIVTTSVVVFCIAAASSFGWILAAEHVPDKMAAFLFSITQDRFWILMLMNALLLFLGTFLDVAPILIIVIPVIWPIAQQLGVSPIHFGVMTIVNMAIGQCTPPVGVTFFVAMGISKIRLGDMLRTYLLFIGAMILVLVLITAFPILITGLPGYVLGI